MSDNAKTLNITYSDSIKVMKTIIDFSVQDGAVGCHDVDCYYPKDHKVVNTEIYVDEALVSGGSATVSIGYDDITTEPDNLLNDSAVAGFADDTLVAGIPVFGTAATHVAVGTSDAQLAYEIKVADITAGVMTVITTLLPTK